MPSPIWIGTLGLMEPLGMSGASTTRMLLTRSIRVEIALLRALKHHPVELLGVVLGPLQALVFDLEQIQLEGVLLRAMKRPREPAFLPLDDREISL